MNKQNNNYPNFEGVLYNLVFNNYQHFSNKMYVKLFYIKNLELQHFLQFFSKQLKILVINNKIIK
jgi:hypothetical protein